MRRTFWPNCICQRFRSKNRSTGLKFTPIRQNSRVFIKNCTKRAFQAMRRTFWPNRIFQRSGANNRSTGLKFTPIRANSRLSMKIVQNVLFALCRGLFSQIAFFNVLDPKIALPDWNSRQYVETAGFLWKLYKTCFSRYAEDVLAKLHLSTF